MFISTPLLIVGAIIAVALIAITVASLGAWYGIWVEAEELRARLNVFQVDLRFQPERPVPDDRRISRYRGIDPQ